MKELSLFVFEFLGQSLNQPKLCSSATWNPNATTFVNGSFSSGTFFGLFIDTVNTIYVPILSHNRIQVWSDNSSVPIRNISAGLKFP